MAYADDKPELRDKWYGDGKCRSKLSSRMSSLLFRRSSNPLRSFGGGVTGAVCWVDGAASNASFSIHDQLDVGFAPKEGASLDFGCSETGWGRGSLLLEAAVAFLAISPTPSAAVACCGVGFCCWPETVVAFLAISPTPTAAVAAAAWDFSGDPLPGVLRLRTTHSILPTLSQDVSP